MSSIKEHDYLKICAELASLLTISIAAAKKKIGYSFECKNVERLNIWQAIEQSESNCEDRIPVVVFKRNRSKTYLTIEFNEFVKLIGEKNVKQVV